MSYKILNARAEEWEGMKIQFVIVIDWVDYTRNELKDQPCSTYFFDMKKIFMP